MNDKRITICQGPLLNRDTLEKYFLYKDDKLQKFEILKIPINNTSSGAYPDCLFSHLA
jgi:hypothetical protein